MAWSPQARAAALASRRAKERASPVYRAHIVRVLQAIKKVGAKGIRRKAH